MEETLEQYIKRLEAELEAARTKRYNLTTEEELVRKSKYVGKCFERDGQYSLIQRIDEQNMFTGIELWTCDGVVYNVQLNSWLHHIEGEGCIEIPREEFNKYLDQVTTIINKAK